MSRKAMILRSFDQLAEHVERQKCIEDMSLSELLRALNRHDEDVRSFYNDPITRAMYVPTRDFQESFDKKERHILCQIMALAPDGSKEQEMALGRLEKWMP